ncbi:hypothetical protein V8G54_020541 [Vigna mungo]|uniref:Uncharacterized protein n=1 Tax=Vigna mungo TaxID=3915 RepID=A0AAQ3NDY5_VIGMU
MAYPNSYYPPQPTTYAPMPAMPTTVIGPQFCAPYPMDLAVVKKVMTIADGNFVVTDVNGNLVFKVKGSIMSLHDRRVLLDAAGHPLVTLRRKVFHSSFLLLPTNTSHIRFNFKGSES